MPSPAMPKRTDTAPARGRPGRFSTSRTSHGRPKPPASFGVRVTLIPFDGVSEVGRVNMAGITVVARDQVVIDVYGGIDRMIEQADILTGRRSP